MSVMCVWVLGWRKQCYLWERTEYKTCNPSAVCLFAKEYNHVQPVTLSVNNPFEFLHLFVLLIFLFYAKATKD